MAAMTKATTKLQRRTRAFAVASVLAIVLTACSTSTDGLSTTAIAAEPTATRTATTPATATAEPVPTATVGVEEATSVPTETGGVDWATELTVGRCFNDGPDINANALVECDGPHDFEIFFASTFDIGPDEPWPGFDSLTDEAFTSFCDDELVRFAGRTYDLLPLTSVAWVPNEDEWNGQSRSAVCTVGTLTEGTKLIGTAAGSSLAPASTDFVISLVERPIGGFDLAIAGPGTDGANITATDIGIYDDAIAFDGSRILWFVADADNNGTRSLMGYQLATSQIVRIDAFDGRDVFNPAVGPGQAVVVSAGYAGSGESELWRIDADGTTSQLTDTPGVFVDDPAVSADGDRIIMSATSDDGGTNLWAIDTETGDLNQLTDGPANDSEPAISPDGSQIVFTSDRSGNLDVWSIEPDGSSPTNLSNHPGDDSQPAFSLATDRVLFQSDRFGLNANTMFMLSDGSEQASVTFEGVRQPEVLPAELGQVIYNATFLNQLRYCDSFDADGELECGTFNDFQVVSVTTNPEPAGAPWPGEEVLIDRLIADCKTALDVRFGPDREPREVEPAVMDQATWDFGARTTACWLLPDQ